MYWRQFPFNCEYLLLDDGVAVAIAIIDDCFGFRHYYCYCCYVALSRAVARDVCDDVLVQLVAFHASAETMDRSQWSL